MQENSISAAALGAAINDHRVLGPGLVESVYEVALAHVLRLSGLRFGLLVNLWVPVLKDGFERLVRDLDEQCRAERAESAESSPQERTPT